MRRRKRPYFADPRRWRASPLCCGRSAKSSPPQRYLPPAHTRASLKLGTVSILAAGDLQIYPVILLFVGQLALGVLSGFPNLLSTGTFWFVAAFVHRILVSVPYYMRPSFAVRFVHRLCNSGAFIDTLCIKIALSIGGSKISGLTTLVLDPPLYF